VYVRKGHPTFVERGSRVLLCHLGAPQLGHPCKQSIRSAATCRGVQRRRDYMERDSIRSDSKLFIGLFVAFVAPAAGILAWAFFSGYLDQLAQGYKRF